MGYRISYAVYSDMGNRSVNEDSVIALQKDDKQCFVLCDGLGGMGMGNYASQLVTRVFENLFAKTDKMSNYLPMAFQASQDVLLAEQQRMHAEAKMKTTAVAVVTDHKKAYIGHVGDSRLYIFKDGKIAARTLDHSIPQMLALTGEIKESEIRHHKNRSILLRTMGIRWEEPMYDLMRPLSLGKCDAFLLCSDGFWELIEDEEMVRLFTISASPQEWIDRMRRVVVERGIGKDMDNNSAIAVRIIKE